MRKIFLVLIVISFMVVGCDKSQDEYERAVDLLAQTCDGDVSVELYFGQYNKGITVRCDKIGRPNANH